jgi:hypothetical protein
MPPLHHGADLIGNPEVVGGVAGVVVLCPPQATFRLFPYPPVDRPP